MWELAFCVRLLSPFLLGYRYRYKEGMLETRKDLSAASSSAVQLAADQLMELSDTHGPEVVEDEDVDELLSWTNALNFDEWGLSLCLH